MSFKRATTLMLPRNFHPSRSHKLLPYLAFVLFCIFVFQVDIIISQTASASRRNLDSTTSEDIAGKVVLITGASSGIGESLAYEYAKKGACLVLAARREKSLQEVAETARYLGSPDVVVVRADVSKVEDCRRIVDQTMNHYGRLDHLVNNAGVTSVGLLEEVENVTDFRAIMDVNFWGAVYMTRFGAPYLRQCRGRVVVVSSSAWWLAAPRMSFYNASKAAMAQFFETVRVEFGPDIGITLVTPGFIESELAQGKYLTKGGAGAGAGAGEGGELCQVDREERVAGGEVPDGAPVVEDDILVEDILPGAVGVGVQNALYNGAGGRRAHQQPGGLHRTQVSALPRIRLCGRPQHRLITFRPPTYIYTVFLYCNLYAYSIPTSFSMLVCLYASQ